MKRNFDDPRWYPSRDDDMAEVLAEQDRHYGSQRRKSLAEQLDSHIESGSSAEVIEFYRQKIKEEIDG